MEGKIPNRPEVIELENNLGPDSVTGEINRVPWMAYDVDEANLYIDYLEKQIAFLKATKDACPSCNSCADAMWKITGEEIDKLKKMLEGFRWRSWKDDPPKFPDSEGFVFCGHQKYDWETEMRYFVDVGHLDVDGTLCMYNDWDEGEQVFEIDYWFPLPKHPEEKETK